MKSCSPGNEVRLPGLGALEHLIAGIKFRWLRKVADVAGVQQERRSRGQRINSAYRLAQRLGNIRIRGLIKSNVAVGNLHEHQFRAGRRTHLAHSLRVHRHRTQHSALQRPQNAGAGPGHALQKSATVHAVSGVIILNVFR